MKISLQTPIAIVGLGLSGESALAFLLAAGFSRKDLITFDEKSGTAQVTDPEVLMRDHRPRTLVVSPGVFLKKPWLVKAKLDGVFITSEISLACSVLKDEKIIGVTGAVGKSTTVSLLGAVLKSADSQAFIGGNLGMPFCDYAKDLLLKKRPHAQWVALELSSFQLENCEGLCLDAAILVSLVPNHLERYSSQEEYYETKLKLLKICKGPFILNEDSPDLLSKKRQISEIAKIAGSTAHWVSSRSGQLTDLNLSQALLVGVHNQQNLALTAQTLLSLGFTKQQLNPLLLFSGLPHRLEMFGSWNGLQFINDSKATALESVLMAVEACQARVKPNEKIHLFLGGRNKNLPWENLDRLALEKNIVFYFFGESRDIIPTKSKLTGVSKETLKELIAD